MKKRFFYISILFVFILSIIPINLQAKDCKLDKKVPYTHKNTRSIWFITKECTKRPFQSGKVYKTYFDSYSAVEITDKEVLQNVPDDKAGFMPWGPNYSPKNGALVKVPSDSTVYFLYSNKKHRIKNQKVFEELNYQWNWVQDVAPSLLKKYEKGDEIDYLDHHPTGSLIKYNDSPKIYKLEKKEGEIVKRHIKTRDVFRKLNYRLDRVITIDKNETYKTGEAITVENITSTKSLVTQVMDGDTIEVKHNNKEKTLRLIGIDAPETKHPDKPIQCFGKESKEKLKELVLDKKVRLKKDSISDDVDKYDRLLRYVYIDDKLVNSYLIKKGYVYAYTTFPFEKEDRFEQLEDMAENNNRGLWAKSSCNGMRYPPDYSNNVESRQNNRSSSKNELQSSDFICSYNNYNCSDFSTQKQAQNVFEACGGVSNDVHYLDADGNGLACESLS
ncbi:MAG: thermonuclease family protein [Candidatus Magasanikbacteria bacterium]